MNNQLLSIVSILALIFSVLSFILGTIALIKIIATEKSTHSVQLTPVDDAFDKINQEYMKQLNKNEDDWATSEEVIDKQGKMFKEELEDKMPSFVEDDNEVISY